MKGLVYAIALFPTAIGAAISLACAPAITDPYLIWPYVALAVASFVTAFAFPTYFKHLNDPIKDFQNEERQAGLYQPNYIKPDAPVDYSGNVEDLDTKEKQ
jgi:POT family proton-dependent oligopeptide transporter